MTALIAILRIIGKPLLWALAAVGVRWDAKRDERLRSEARDAKATTERLRAREEIEDAIDADPDLVARARRSGLLRDK